MPAGDRTRPFQLTALGLFIVAALASPCAAEDEPGLDARTFNSALALRVVVVSERGDPTQDCIVGRRQVVGTTPAREPIAIPACFLWFVEPIDPTIQDDTLSSLAKEIKAESIPGLSLLNCDRLTDRGMKALAGRKELVYLSIRGTLISSNGMAKLRKLPALRFLDGRPGALMGLEWAKKFTALELADFSGHRTLQGPELKSLRGLKHLDALRLVATTFVTDRSIDEIVKLKQLRELDIGFCRQVTAAGVTRLAAMKNLESLCIDAIQVTDETVAALSEMPALTTLRMRGAQNVTNTSLAHIGRIATLRQLDIRNCYQLTDAGLTSLLGLRELRTLRIAATRGITNAGLATVGKMQDLEELELAHAANVTDEGLAQLAGLTQLRSLQLQKSGISDAGLVHLKKCEKLETLILRGCEVVADAGLEDLIGLPLVRLDLSETGVGDLGLAHVGAIQTLEALDLAKATFITDDGLASLATNQKLRTLDLSGVVELTDGAAKHLAKLKGLRTLDLVGSGVTVRGVREIREALPGCEVEH